MGLVALITDSIWISLLDSFFVPTTLGDSTFYIMVFNFIASFGVHIPLQ